MGERTLSVVFNFLLALYLFFINSESRFLVANLTLMGNPDLNLMSYKLFVTVELSCHRGTFS